MKTHFFLRNLLIISLLLVATSFTDQKTMAAEVIAEINGQPLTKSEFERRYQEQLRMFRYTPPTRKNVLDDIINFELTVQEAKRKGINKDPQIQERISMVLVQGLLEKEMAAKIARIDVTDSEVKKLCKTDPELRTSVIFIPQNRFATPSAKENARKKAGEALAKLKKGIDFEEVVAEYSSGPSVANGGDMGYLTKDKMDPTYYAKAKALEIGRFSNIVTSQFGLHIIKLTGRKPCRDINTADWKRMIYNMKKMKLYEQYYAELRKKSKVKINSSFLN